MRSQLGIGKSGNADIQADAAKSLKKAPPVEVPVNASKLCATFSMKVR